MERERAENVSLDMIIYLIAREHLLAGRREEAQEALEELSSTRKGRVYAFLASGWEK